MFSSAFEIDFFPVGKGDRSGDAIVVRYGSEWWEWKIMVIDGGTKDSGEAVVKHIREVFGADRIDYVVNTHPDMDHASGLSVVLEELEVGELWMHRPWEHSEDIRHMFKDGRITESSLAERTKEALKAAWALEELATEKGIPIKEPFQGAQIGDFTVLSPDKEWYQSLICQFRKTPDAKDSSEDQKFLGSVLLGRAMQKVMSWVDEALHIETLGENASTSAENETSVILYGKIDTQALLFTGDAGVLALETAADYADENDIELQSALSLIQVPHHGSRNNVTPSILNRVIGEIGASRAPLAIVSASAESEIHPRKVVVNAFIRRGCRVFRTSEGTLHYRHNLSQRPGYSSAEPLPFYQQVEDYAEGKAANA